MDTQDLAQKKARIKKDLKILQAIKAKWRPQKERFPIIYQGFKDQEKNLVDQYNELKKLEKGPAGPKKEKEKEKTPASTEKKASKKEEPKDEEKITVPIDEDEDFESDDEWDEMDMEIKEEGPAKKKGDAKKLPPVDIKADTISDEDALTLEKDDDDEFESDDDEEDENWEEMEVEGEKKGVKAKEEDDSDKSSKKKIPFAKGGKPASKPILKKAGDPKGSEDKDKLKALAKGLKKRTKK